MTTNQYPAPTTETRRILRHASLCIAGLLILGACSSSDPEADATDEAAAPASSAASPPATAAAGSSAVTTIAGDPDPASEAETAESFSLVGHEVTLGRATRTAPGPPEENGTNGEAVTLEELVGAEPGFFESTRTVGDTIEFPSYLSIWKIDIEAAAITFDSTGTEPWEGAWRTHGDGEYTHITIEGLADVTSAVADDPTVDLELTDEGLVVGLGPGFVTNTGFRIELT